MQTASAPTDPTSNPPKQCGSPKVATEGRALVVAANKSDLSGVTPKEYAQGVIAQVEELMPDMRAPPVVSVCALNGERLRFFVRYLGLIRALRNVFRGRALQAFPSCGRKSAAVFSLGGVRVCARWVCHFVPKSPRSRVFHACDRGSKG